MSSPQVGSNEKLEVLADLIYLAKHSPAGAELQLRCLDLAAEVLLQGEVSSIFSRRGMTERWHLWLQTRCAQISAPGQGQTKNRQDREFVNRKELVTERNS
jgi:hypothetical protein